MNKLMQVRKEYGEPFVEVVRGFARQRNSISLTAETLGFNKSYFYQLLDRFDLRKEFHPVGLEQRQECRGGTRQGARSIHRWKRPIEVNGILYYPGEPTYHYQMELRRKAREAERQRCSEG